MNILFLVSSFLIIFTFLSSSILKNSLFFSAERKSAASYLQGKQRIRSKWECYKYKTYQEKSAKKKKQKLPSFKKGQPYISPRLKKDVPLLAKWNLSPLLETQGYDAYWEQAGASLLKDLYGHTLFWQKASEKTSDLAEKLMSSFLATDSCKSLADLFPQDPSLQFVFYKMLKGSGKYCINPKEGYPPLSAFFCIQPENKKILSMPYASYPALKALFGEKVAQEILVIEKEKSEDKGAGYYTISQMEFTHLVRQKNPHMALESLKSLLQFSHKKASLDHLSYEDKDGLLLQMNLPQKTKPSDDGMAKKK